MKKTLFIVLWIVLPCFVFAQPSTSEFGTENVAAPTTDIISGTPKFEEDKIIPNLVVSKFIEVEKPSLFDASLSKKMAPSEGEVVYSWDFGDGSEAGWGEKVTHKFSKPGKYLVTLKVRQGKNRESLTQEVVVFFRKGVLITDSNFDSSGLISQAGTYGIWLDPIKFEKLDAGFSTEENFGRLLQEKTEFLREADLIVFHTKSPTALQSFSQWWQKISPENKFDLTKKLWVQISDGSLEQAQNLARPSFRILQPKFIFLTRPEALSVLFETSDLTQLSDKLNARSVEFLILDSRSNTSFFLLFSRLTTYFISHGVSQNIVYLLFAVPFIVFLISFFRQVLGISTFGVFTPLALTLSFLLLGLSFGFMAFSLVMVVSYLIRIIFERVQLLYIPRVALLFSVLSILFFLVSGIALYFDSSINLALAVFPMLVMSTISEKFLSAQIEGGLRNAVIIAGETVFVSLVSYAFVNWNFIESSILALPELIFIPILGNIWLGKFTGLRLSEYFKFRSILREENQEE